MIARNGTFFLLFLLLCGLAQAAGSKNGEAQISFHLQADPGDSPKMIFGLPVADGRMAFKRVHELNTKDVASYKAIPSKQHQGIYDIVIQFKPHAAKKLQLLTNANRGKYIVPLFNGRSGEAMMINEQVDDGTLVVWSLANAEDLKLLAESFEGAVETR